MPSLDPPGGVIPTSRDELTATWLAAVFTRNGFSAAIESIDFRPIEASPFTSEMLRIVPRVQDETTGVAPPLLWKRSLDDATRRAAFRRGYRAEVEFYRDVAPRVHVATPRCLVAAYSEQTDAHVLVLEEIDGSAGDVLEGVPPEQAERVLRELARLHASRWTATAEPYPPEHFARLESLVREHAPASTPYLTEHVDRRVAARTQRYAAEVSALFARLSAGPQTLTHGDAHPGNVIVPASPNARPVLVDWQGARIDAPMRDVARFLVLGLTTEERRVHEEWLLAAYLAELEANGARYDRSAAARDYRTASLLQWGWAVIFFRLEPFWDPNTRAAMPSLVRRAAAAFDDTLH